MKHMLFSIKMDENASFQEHLLKIEDWEIEEEDMVVIALKSFLCAYEHFIMTLKITATNAYIKI